jgi:hypothetical protein
MLRTLCRMRDYGGVGRRIKKTCRQPISYVSCASCSSPSYIGYRAKVHTSLSLMANKGLVPRDMLPNMAVESNKKVLSEDLWTCSTEFYRVYLSTIRSGRG